MDCLRRIIFLLNLFLYSLFKGGGLNNLLSESQKHLYIIYYKNFIYIKFTI